MTGDTLNPGLPEWQRAVKRARDDAQWSVNVMGEVAACLDSIADAERRLRFIALTAEARGRHGLAAWARHAAATLRVVPVTLPPETPAPPPASLPCAAFPPAPPMSSLTEVPR